MDLDFVRAFELSDHRISLKHVTKIFDAALANCFLSPPRFQAYKQGHRIATIPRGATVMAMRILWPNLPAQLVPVATEAVGPGFETQFREKFEDVTDEQWANADAVARVVGEIVRMSDEDVAHELASSSVA